MIAAIREIYTVGNGDVLLHLPKKFWGQEVEIIVIPLHAQPRSPRRKTSLRGCLQQYANPELMAKEQEAWQDAVMEKYGSC